MGTLKWIAALLIVIGAINWGLVGLLGINLVTIIFGDGGTLTNIIYDLIGLAGVWALFWIWPKK